MLENGSLQGGPTQQFDVLPTGLNHVHGHHLIEGGILVVDSNEKGVHFGKRKPSGSGIVLFRQRGCDDMGGSLYRASGATLDEYVAVPRSTRDAGAQGDDAG